MADQVLLNISGGQPTEDFDVQIEDIIIYIANLIPAVVLEDSRRRRQEDRQDRVGTSGIDGSFLITEFLKVETDSNVGLKFARFIKKPLLMDKIYGIAEVGPKKPTADRGDRPFVKLASRYDGVGLSHLMAEETRWFYENDQGVQKIYFKGISHAVEEIRVSYVPSYEDLDADEIVPLPSGLEIDVVNRATVFFQQEADRPADGLNNHNDDRIR